MSPSPQNKLRKTLRTRRASVLAKTSIINKKKVPQKAALHRLIHDSGELIKKKTSMLDGPDNTPQFLQPKPVPTTENSVDCDYAPDELKPKTSSRTDESGVGDNVSDKLNPETMLPLKEDNRQKKSKIEKGKPTERKTKSVELSHYDSSESLDQYSESKNYDKNDGTDSHVEPILNQKDASDFDPESEDDQWEPENIHVNDTLEVFDNEDHSASDTDAETISGNCIDGMLKGFNKDIGALYNKTNSIEMEIKEIKRLLKSLSTQHCACRSLTSQFKQNSASSLLPKFPFLRKSEVRKMENNSGENEDYKLQMVIHTPTVFVRARFSMFKI